MAEILISLVSAVAIVVVVRAACRDEGEAERLQRLNAWQHWPAPQSPAELEQQVAGSRDAREWAQVLAGHE